MLVGGVAPIPPPVLHPFRPHQRILEFPSPARDARGIPFPEQARGPGLCSGWATIWLAIFSNFLPAYFGGFGETPDTPPHGAVALPGRFFDRGEQSGGGPSSDGQDCGGLAGCIFDTQSKVHTAACPEDIFLGQVVELGG